MRRFHQFSIAHDVLQWNDFRPTFPMADPSTAGSTNAVPRDSCYAELACPERSRRKGFRPFPARPQPLRPRTHHPRISGQSRGLYSWVGSSDIENRKALMHEQSIAYPDGRFIQLRQLGFPDRYQSRLTIKKNQILA